VLAPSFDLEEQEMRVVMRIFILQVILICDSVICSCGFIDIPVADPTSVSQLPV
jgi:hypothetical protein